MTEKKEWQPPRGTRDYLPKEMATRNKVFAKMRRVFELYGYGEVSTPAFEDFDLLAAKSGPEIEEEIYAFEDKGKRKLGLRFDPTVPICRIVASNPSLTKPIRFYYITNMWRYDRPQAGRYREFWQAGLELIGAKGANADAEILGVANDLLTSVTDKEFYFRISSRKIIEEIAERAGIPKSKREGAFRAIDKLDKVGEDDVRGELERCGVTAKVSDKFFDLIKKQDADIGELKEIKEAAEKMGVKNIEIDLSIVRGIDYYTGFVFETLVRGSEKLGSVCSGGRYDSLIGLYGGGDLPATGFGLGIDRLLDIIGYDEDYYPTRIFVAAVNDEVRDVAVKITRILREEGISAETDLMQRNLRKQFEYINARGIPFAVIIGPREVEENKIVLRDMATGKEDKICLKDIKEWL
ncbi:histidine--tRNA ligase [Candidatus Micrarchaeota archaeon]|nr:histidine--tRNA ligase [Candidatus Micrarchaeota archaeon]